VNRHADALAEAVIADGRDEDALREAGVGSYGAAVVAIGEDLEANILCTMNVRMLGVPRIWAKAKNRTHHRILARLDVDRVVLAEQEIGRHVAQVLHNPLIRDYVSLGNGFNIVDLHAPEHVAGRRVEDLDLEPRFDVRLLGAMRGTEHLPPDAQLEEGDKLLLLGRRVDLRRLAESL
jgi:trk system potassium uptake protein TrkA